MTANGANFRRTWRANEMQAQESKYMTRRGRAYSDWFSKVPAEWFGTVTLPRRIPLERFEQMIGEWLEQLAKRPIKYWGLELRIGALGMLIDKHESVHANFLMIGKNARGESLRSRPSNDSELEAIWRAEYLWRRMYGGNIQKYSSNDEEFERPARDKSIIIDSAYDTYGLADYMGLPKNQIAWKSDMGSEVFVHDVPLIRRFLVS